MFPGNIFGTDKERAPTQTRSQSRRRPAKVYDILLNYVTYHTFSARPRECVCMPQLLIFYAGKGAARQADMTQGRVNGMECVQGHGDNIATHHHHHHHPRSNRRL